MLSDLKKSQFIIFIILSFAIHCLASYFSVGFYSQDEHFQILSPVEFLLGINDNLYEEIWEFSEDYRIRPWFQSYLYFYIIKSLQFLSVENPFIWIFFIKILFSLLSLATLILFYLNFKNRLFIDNNFNRFLILLFCFYPFFHSRTSSENLGMSFFIIGILIFDFLINSKSNKKKKGQRMSAANNKLLKLVDDAGMASSTDKDQLTADMRFIDNIGVMGCLGDADHTISEFRQIRFGGFPLKFGTIGKKAFQRYRIGKLATFDQALNRREYPAVKRIIEMIGH